MRSLLASVILTTLGVSGVAFAESEVAPVVQVATAEAIASETIAKADPIEPATLAEPVAAPEVPAAQADPVAEFETIKPRAPVKTKAAAKPKTKTASTKKKSSKTVAKTRTAKKTRPVAKAGADSFAFNKAAKAYLVRVQDKDLWSAGDEERLPPASLTKIMTALLILEDYRPDDVTTITKDAAAEPRSKIGLRAGDKMYVADLLAAALIHSANDACHALADYRDGSEEKFVERMNRRAQQLGLKNTHFVNACGFDAPDHYSTARDIAVLADLAMQNPTFARMVRKQKMVIPSVVGKRRFAFNTTNAMIGHYPGMMGGKTGFTNGAGPCLVALAERDGVRVLLVLLNSRNRWWNASGMFDLAFAQASRG